MTKRLLPLLFAAAGAACSSGSTSPAGPSVPTATPTPPPPPTARYSVTFDAVWSDATHPNETPPVPHFSGLIGATHREDVRFWQVDGLATEGIRNMAEEGRKSPLDAEVEAAIAAGTAQHLLSGGGINPSPASVSLEFEVSRDYPLVTLVSMVAPSPDWFVGVSALPLFENGNWVSERVVSLRPYDAGTDSGRTFLSKNRPSNPREPIARITDGPLVVGSDVPPLGTFTFRRIN